MDVGLGDLLATLAAELAIPLNASAGVGEERVRVTDLTLEMPARLALVSVPGAEEARITVGSISPRDSSATAIGKLGVVIAPSAPASSGAPGE